MAVRQTSCKHCGLDIENTSPYRRGEWRDRGNNTHCPDQLDPTDGNGDPQRTWTNQLHTPYRENGRMNL